MKFKFNEKIVIFTVSLLFSIAVLIFLSYIVYSSFLNKLSLENYSANIHDNDENFKIDKIVLFSGCDSHSVTNTNNTTTINNLYQYTDIAIFLNSSNTSFSLANTLKSVVIKDFSFNTLPSLGTPNLYYKSLDDFSTSNFDANNVLDKELTFSISDDDQIDYSEPILFNNCANPITLSYVNSDIINDYTVTNTNNSITYDGSLLKKCNVLLNDLNCSLSFVIYIENNLGESFKCPVYIDIPLKDDSSSIYDGSYTYTYNPDYSFSKVSF